MLALGWPRRAFYTQCPLIFILLGVCTLCFTWLSADPLSGKFDNVRGPEAREIRVFMAERIETLLSQLAAHGLHRTGGESPVVLPSGEKKSVDLRCWFSPKAANCLLELKWTRQNLQTALVAAKSSLPWLKVAAKGGVWARGRKQVSLALDEDFKSVF